MIESSINIDTYSLLTPEDPGGTMQRFGNFTSTTLLMASIVIFASCGSKSSDDTTAVAPTWADVSTIITASCLGSSCHTSGANTSICGDFTASEALYKAAQACTTEASRPGVLVASGSMPKTGTITAAQKSTLVNFK
jgi:hypothetical protein